jgi:hypothetical protein
LLSLSLRKAELLPNGHKRDEDKVKMLRLLGAKSHDAFFLFIIGVTEWPPYAVTARAGGTTAIEESFDIDSNGIVNVPLRMKRRALESVKLPGHPKLIVVVTDPNANLWSGWACRDAFMAIAPNNLARERLLTLGVEASKIVTIGMPVDPYRCRFSQADQATIRHRSHCRIHQTH